MKVDVQMNEEQLEEEVSSFKYFKVQGSIIPVEGGFYEEIRATVMHGEAKAGVENEQHFHSAQFKSLNLLLLAGHTER